MNKVEQEFINAMTDGSILRAFEEFKKGLTEMSLAWAAVIGSAVALLAMMTIQKIAERKRREARKRVLEWEGVWLWD